MSVNNYYKLGGCLEYQHLTYVVRKADLELYEYLKNSEFCYVLNSRQMGKSSLRVQMMKKLKEQGVKCASIDLTRIGSYVTPQEWYAGVVSELLRGFGLSRKVNFSSWWREREVLPPLERLSDFIEDILFREFSQNIVIMFDEIDSILKIKFRDDFFAFIRACYNHRVENTEYKRLTFCLLGVATPSDLIQDKNRTPFNIGHAIQLSGFQLHEAQPLSQGLSPKVRNPQPVLKEVLAWTGGQPFLTQKLCHLIITAESLIPSASEKLWIENLVQTSIIENWESQDEPEHLRTIRDRLLRNEQRAGRLLGLYQQVLQHGEVATDDSSEQMELLLTGLVVRCEGKLRLYNRIYASVFNQNWLDKALAELRPYAETLKAWVDSNYQDDSRLLRGQALQDALVWKIGKSLSELDYQFLDASLELEKRQMERTLEVEKQASQVLAEANQTLLEAQRKAIQKIRIGSVVLAIAVAAAAIVGVLAQARVRQAKIELKETEVVLHSTSSQAFFNQGQEFEALLEALRVAKQLRDSEKSLRAKTDLQMRVVGALQQAIYGVKERNRLEKHSAGVLSVSVSPDGKTLASASYDKTIKLWSIDGRELITLRGHSAAVTSVSFSPDGKTIASASNDKTIKLWNLQGKELITIKGHRGEVMSVSFSPDGKTLASASYDKTIKLWSLHGKELMTFRGHSNVVRSVSFSPNGKTLASASDDKTIKLWSLQGKELMTLKGHSGEVRSISFSPNGKMIASASNDKTIKLWSIDGRERVTLRGHSGEVRSVSFSPDGKRIASSSYDKTIKIWSIDGREQQTLKGHNGSVISVRFIPVRVSQAGRDLQPSSSASDRAQAFSKGADQTIASASLDGTIKLWSINNWKPMTLKGHSGKVNGVSFSPDGKTIASASADQTIKLWNLQGKELMTLKGHTRQVRGISFSPDGKTIASASADQTIKLWNLQGKELTTLKGHSGEVRSVSFSPDGQTIASASADKTIKLWSIQGKELMTLKGHSGEVRSVSCSPEGKTIASASADKTIKLWNLQGKELMTFKGHTDKVNSVSFSPDGKTIASASWDSTIKLWNLQGLMSLTGHSDGVNRVSFSADGQTIASASADSTSKLWSIDGKELMTLKAYGGEVTSISFSPDGHSLACANSDKTVTVWNLNLDSLMSLGCSWVRNYLQTNPKVRESDKHLCQSLRMNSKNRVDNQH